jgi:DNA-binding winged helix-turn-helix (wHTH) protein
MNSMRVAFAEFVLDSGERRLMRGDSPVHLTGKAFQLLALLVAERPKVVPKKEIYDALWPNVYVQEANIKNLIAELRSVIGDQIRTHRGVGYAFKGEAREEVSLAPSRFSVVINGVAFALREGRNIIGREPAAHIRLDLAAVSRRHAAINIHGEEAVVQDLGSRNGTWLNGEKLEAARSLRTGDEIRIAQTAIRLQIAPGSARPTAPLGSRV